MSPRKYTAPSDKRPSAAKQALPGAKRGPSTFMVDPNELVIMGYDNGKRDHHLYDPTNMDPPSHPRIQRRKRSLLALGKQLTAVRVTLDGDKKIVVNGRDRVKALREINAENPDRTWLVRCEVAKGLPTDLFQEMLAENEERRQRDDVDPISRARLMQNAVDQLGEEGAAAEFNCSVSTIKGATKLLELIPEVQEAVASGDRGEVWARNLHGLTKAEQKAALTAPVVRAAPRPSLKKVAKVEAGMAAWKDGGNPLAEALLKWFAGDVSDEDLAKQFPHVAGELAKKKVAT